MIIVYILCGIIIFLLLLNLIVVISNSIRRHQIQIEMQKIYQSILSQNRIYFTENQKKLQDFDSVFKELSKIDSRINKPTDLEVRDILKKAFPPNPKKSDFNIEMLVNQLKKDEIQ